jgi:ATP-dependent 26S proteasome regulatory subunit
VKETIETLLLNIRARYPFVYLLTWEEKRAHVGIADVAKRTGRALWTWSVAAGLTSRVEVLDDTGPPEAALDAIRDMTDPVLVVLHDFHHYIAAPKVQRRMRDLSELLARREQCLILLSPQATVPRELEKDIVVLTLPLPGLKEVARLFHKLIIDRKLKVDLELFERFVKASLGLTAEEIRRVYRKVLLRNQMLGEEQLAEVIAEKSHIIRRSKYLEFHDLSMSITDVGGLEQLKDWLRSRDQSFTEKARKYGLPQPKGLFLLGVQGCGKSLTAKAVADLWKVPLLRLDVGALVQEVTGVDEGLRHAIALAESMAPVVLWVDEIEKAFAGVDGEGGAAAARLFGNFVTWLQEKTKPVFVIATANNVRALPPELLRKGRFDEIFFVDLPNIHERQTIFEIHIRRRRRSPRDFDTWELAEATEKFSGAEIEQAVIDGMFLAFADDREVSTHDVLRSIRETVPLAVTMDQSIKDLKEWARDRTRPATYDTRRIDFFEEWEAGDTSSV